MCHLALWVVTMCVLLPESAATQTVPEEAFQAARDYLEREIGRAKEDSTYFQRMWNVEGLMDFAAVSVAEPFAQYVWSDEAVRDFADSKVSEFGEGAQFVCWVFPVFCHDDYLGSLRVRSACGVWGVGSQSLVAKGNRAAPAMVRMVSRIRGEYPPERGYRLSTLVNLRMGCYLLVYADGKLFKIAQIAYDPYGTPGLSIDEDGLGLLVPIGEARDHLLSVARKLQEMSHQPDALKSD